MAELYEFKTKPDPYQVDALKKALRFRKYGIFFEQRVGKTKVAIDFCGALNQKEGLNKTLILCPLSVRTEWEAQIGVHYPFGHEVFLYPKGAENRKELLATTKKYTTPVFLVVNYDLLSRDIDALKDWGAQIIIYDESHLIGHHNSKRSKAAASLSKPVNNILLLTGTPIPKRWYHIFGQFRAMNTRIFGQSFVKFIDKWGVRGGYLNREIEACKDYEGLSKVISNHSIRVLRQDVFNEPEIEHITIPVALTGKTKITYDKLRKSLYAELEAARYVSADLAITRLIRLQQICGGFVTADDGTVQSLGKDKLTALKDLVHTRLEGGEKVVIFYRYVAEGIAILRELRSLTPHPIGRLGGSVSESRRLEYRKMFQEGKSEIMLVQIAAGAMGISLDKAHTNIFYSMDFSLSNYKQARDRVMGRGQKSPVVTNYYLVAEHTTDVRILETLQKDEDLATLISDSWKWVFGEED